MGFLAQTTQAALSESPDVWTNRIAALSGLIVALTAFVTLWRRIGGVKDRQDVQEDRQDVQETNAQTLATVVIANQKAIDASPGPCVSPDAKCAAQALASDAGVAVATPKTTDPVQPPQPRIQT